MGEVLYLFRCLRHRLPMKALEQVHAIADTGFEGCAHGRRGSYRQVLLVEGEIVQEFGLAPGTLKENVTTGGIVLRGLSRGQRLRVGEALLELTLPCEPCGRMDDIRFGLQQELRGKRGVLARVVEAGWIRRGDRIEIVEPSTPR